MNNHPELPKSIQVTGDGTVVYFWHRFNVMILVFLVFDLWMIWILGSGLTKNIERSTFDIFAEHLCASPVYILSYYILARLLNRTEFWVKGNELFIQHKPLPWFGSRVIPLSELEGFTLDVTHAGGTYYHLLVDIRDKPRSRLFPVYSTIFTDLTNDTRQDVAVALHRQLVTLVQGHASAAGPIMHR